MVMFTRLTTRQLLERANYHIENAGRTTDSKVASVLCDDAVSTLSRVRLAADWVPKYADDHDLREGIASAYLALGRVQVQWEEHEDAKVSNKKADKWR